MDLFQNLFPKRDISSFFLFRFDTDLELIYYAHGGILNYMVRKLVKQSTS